MEKKDKIAIARTIADAIAVERIYGMDYEQDKKPRIHLIIVASAPMGARINELEPFVVMAINLNEGVTFKIYDRSEVRRLQKEGSIYYLSCCDVSNLLYQAKDAAEMPSYTKAEIGRCFRQAALDFRNAMLRIGSFENGARFFMENNDPAVALFMLHQVCELSCRALEIGICGNDKRSHNIAEHQNYLLSMVPWLGLLPNANGSDLVGMLLEQLEKAYSAVRYDSGFSADGIDIQAVYQLAGDFRNRAEATMEMFLENENKLSVHEASIPEPTVQVLEHMEPSSGDGMLTGILEIIKHHLEPKAVYQIGMRTGTNRQDHIFGGSSGIAKSVVHYDLLVISEVTYPYGLNVQQHIADKWGGEVSVLLLIHGHNEFSTALRKGNVFFHAIAKSGKLLFGKQIPSRMIPADPCSYGTGKLDSSMKFRTTSAEELCAFSGELLKKGHMVLAFSMMCQAVEQTYLGLIFGHLEYSPNLHSMGHLLKICTMFWPDAHLYFPRASDADRLMFRRLSDGRSLARHGNDERHGWKDAWETNRRVRVFLDAANAFSATATINHTA